MPVRAHPRRLDLDAVEASLRAVQRDADADLRGLSGRDPLDDRVVDNLLAGYAQVDALVAQDVDVFAMGQLRRLLDLNGLVLCGPDTARREAYAGHLDATEHRFYDHHGGGIRDVVEWHAMHERDSAWDLAAGLHLRLLSRPQLFLEGNHRTSALVMSYVLLRRGQPPFVLSPETAAAYFEDSAAIRDMDRTGSAMRFRGPVIKQRLAKLLEDHSDPRYLRS